MNAMYESEFGWAIELPPNWKRLSRRNSGEQAPVAVFSTPDDWSLSLTWMTSGRSVNEKSLADFDRAMFFSGRINVEDAAAIVDPIFPLVGKILSAAVVTLSDGQRALEYVETISEKNNLPVKKMSYSLILPAVNGSYRNPIYFQRLSFSATPSEFENRIADIVHAVRSFTQKQKAA